MNQNTDEVNQDVTDNSELKEQITSIAENEEHKSDMEQDKGNNLKKGWKKELKEWIVALVVAVVVAVIIRTFIFEPVRVSGESMRETLQNNEIMLVTKYDYWLGKPSRFDVITCHYPNRKDSFVKRIVGVPGDTISMVNGKLTVNGIEYEEEYIVHRPLYEFNDFTLGEDQYFVLGDNRPNSNDSHIIGPINRNQIIGHVRVVVYPFNAIRTIDLPNRK